MRRDRLGIIAFSILMIVSGLPSVVFAQLPAPRLDWVYPPGGQAASSIEVTVGGADLDELSALQFDHPGIVARPKMTEASEFVPATAVANVFLVDIAADVPVGLYEARVSGRFGASNTKRFGVGPWANVTEATSNKSLEAAQSINLGTVVNGRAEANTRDYFKLNLTAGQRITIEALTDAIGSRMAATLELLDLDGKELRKVRGTSGFRSVIDFTAPEDGVYVVSIYDFLFRGSADYFYRLAIHGGPSIEWLEPAVVSEGVESQLQVVGHHLGDDAKPLGIQLNGQPLEHTLTSIASPVSDPNGYAEWLLPVSGYPLKVVPFSIANGAGSSYPVPLVVTSLPVEMETEKDREPTETPQVIQVPCVVSGRFADPNDADLYEFKATAGQVLWIELFAHRLGMPVDGFIVCQQVITKEDGTIEYKKLHDVDDPGDRNGLIGSDFDLSTDDPGFRLQVPADGTYRLVLTDQFGGTRDDPRVRYLLRIRPESPGLDLIVEPALGRPGNGNQAIIGTVSLRPNGTEKMVVRVLRQDGFTGAVKLAVKGLPPGVTAAPLTIPPQLGTGTLVLHAGPGVENWQGELQVVGTFENNGQTQEVLARAGTLVWGTDNRGVTATVSRMTRRLRGSVTTAETEPVTIGPTNSEGLQTARGATFEIPVKMDRRLDFKAALAVNAVGLPGEIKPAGPVQFAENAGEGKLVLNLGNNNIRPGNYRVLLQGDLKYKQARNPEAITKATERQKQIEAWSAEWQTKKEAAAKTMAELPGMKEQVTARVADSLAKAAESDNQLVTQATATANAGTLLAEARTQLAANTEDAALQKKVEQTLASFESASRLMEKSLEARDAAKKQVTTAQAEMAALMAMAGEAQEVLAVADQKIAQLAELKKQADTQFDAVNKANQPVDRTYSVTSLPIDFVVEASPMTLGGDNSEIQAGTEGAVKVRLSRKYGFADAVQLTATPASPVAGLTIEPASMPGDQSESAIVVKTTPETPAGEYPINIKSTAKFNNVDVESTTTITLKILPRA